MGSEEEDKTPPKSSKPKSSAQETPAVSLYPDWTSSPPSTLLAYYGSGATPPFFPSPVSSHAPHPYMWGGQHPLLPPYGSPVPYPAMYPPGAVYTHPNMAMVPSQMQENGDSGAKASKGKRKASGKKTNRKSGNKAGDIPKEVSGSGCDDGTTPSSGGDGSTEDPSDENNNNELSASKKGSFDQMLADGAAHAQNSAVVSVPVTNLNIGMTMWNPSAPPGANIMQPNPSMLSPVVVPTPVMGHEGMITGHWMPDERELKRQKRKQSNRESARRSRLRKQAECEELQKAVGTLTNDNRSLRDEVQKVSEERLKLRAENEFIKEEVMKKFGPDAVPKFVFNETMAADISANPN
ncbi:unnamed protein product [Cuscuta epithymum]|uniref:BZIP domain-containing protein n=1 Tax=Cuscuta epithymum TaxID=186058 RepID=A0AAV0DB56_9ASTE|nr:unnamed protein product [Cuscuta epithymum]